jgi:hypothetical protein
MTAFTVLALAAMTTSASATPVNPTITNGSFQQTLLPISAQFGTAFPTQQVTGWTTTGYNFVFLPGTVDTTGAVSKFGGNPVKMWGPNDGSNNGLGLSPDGGNFLALDGNFNVAAVSQVLNNLIVGRKITVDFYFAAAQQFTFTGATTEKLTVSLGSESHSTETLTTVSKGFSGWQSESITFSPTATSETLSFLATGTPTGVPPYALLDGVSISESPEPSSLALFATGLVGAGGFLRKRFKLSRS